MDIGSNELTRPFRIPRLHRTESGEKVSRRSSNQMESRESVASTRYSSRPNRSSIIPNSYRSPLVYGKPIVPVKRKATSSTEIIVDKNSHSKCGHLMDEIMESMILPKKTDGALRNPSVSPLNTHRDGPISDSFLTRERLEYYTSTLKCHSFTQKGLMEKLLEQKMRTGRIEPYSYMGPFLRMDIGEYQVEEEDRSGKSVPKRGPRTPPGSPIVLPPDQPPPTSLPLPPPSSSDSQSASFRGRSQSDDSLNASASDQDQKQRRRIASSRRNRHNNRDSQNQLIDQIAVMANVPSDKLSRCLDANFLTVLKDIDQSALLTTVHTVLNSIAQSRPNDVMPAPEVSSSTSPDRRKKATVMSGESNEMVAMELESEHSDDGEKAPPPLPPLPPSLTPPPPPPPPPDADYQVWTSPIGQSDTPNQDRVIRTLMQALAIPTSNDQHQIPLLVHPFNSTPSVVPHSNVSVQQMPTLLDRYGIPLPIPTRLQESIGTFASHNYSDDSFLPPPPPPMGNSLFYQPSPAVFMRPPPGYPQITSLPRHPRP